MAATQTLVAGQLDYKQPQERFSPVPVLVSGALTVVAVLIHGYHPYAEDGGIYLPGILKLIHPELYPTWTGFVTAQTRFSLFAPAVAAAVHFSGISLMWWVFCIYVLSIWGTLYAGWRIAASCLQSAEARYGAVSILALCITAPAAGTSLLLIDPYVTARSISTPLGLLAIAGTLEFIAAFRQSGALRLRSLSLAISSLLIAALMHPLMASYTACGVVLLVCASVPNRLLRNLAFAGLASFALLLGAVVNFLAPAQPHGYAVVALSRNYWFLSGWHWYEICGVVAPLFVLWAVARNTTILNESGRWLARMAVWAGLTALEVSLVFVHQSAHNLFVAMLQPLRLFQVVYLIMILLVGAMMAGLLLERDAVRWTATFVVLGALMFFVQVQTFPHSAHIELPGRTPSNDWERGFVWIRNNTPADATIALDAHYIEGEGEDAQSFRAISERSSPPDYTKDGGIAAVDPALTPQWSKGEALQIGLARLPDSERRTRLAQASIAWVVLPARAATAFACPYQNPAMKVCRVPDR